MEQKEKWCKEFDKEFSYPFPEGFDSRIKNFIRQQIKLAEDRGLRTGVFQEAVRCKELIDKDRREERKRIVNILKEMVDDYYGEYSNAETLLDEAISKIGRIKR